MRQLEREQRDRPTIAAAYLIADRAYQLLFPKAPVSSYQRRLAALLLNEAELAEAEAQANRA